MINISRLYCGVASESDGLRYGRGGAGAPAPSAAERRPVVVWNVTRTCNLRCLHCYSDSAARRYPGELTTGEAREVIRDLAAFRVPAVLFSGGEPLLRRDLFALVAGARRLGLRPTLSTNGTLITEEMARRIRGAGFTYVGISLDGIGEVHDYFRGMRGAFGRTVGGFRHCVAAGQRVGLRLTLTRHTAAELHRIFDFIEAEQINRACFYHLVTSGRGRSLTGDQLSPAETRRALDIILERTADFARRGLAKEILTVDNHADGVYVYLKLLAGDPGRAGDVLRLLEWNGGGLHSSGVGIGAIDWVGDVHADQFWTHYCLGNVKRRAFSHIWQDTADPLMAGLKDRRSRITGRCRACRFFNACGGALRVRAELATGDPWAPDPACYLTDAEVGLPVAVGAAGPARISPPARGAAGPTSEVSDAS
jgi:radical SAM protein with 4Fe4S-binding SPASM domain